MALLEVKNLAKSYARRRVVDDVTLEVDSGQIVGLLGKNGAGKTTVFGMIVGLIRPESGSIHLAGERISRLPMHLRARRGLGYLPQEPSVFQNMSVEMNIAAILETLPIGRKERRANLARLLEEMGLGNVAKSPAYTLSGGERRKLEITRALVTNPAVIMLDEPFSGVDPIAVFQIREIIAGLRNRGIGILLTDHNVIETLTVTDRSYIMDAGKIRFQGTSSELVNNNEARQLYLGEQFTMSYDVGERRRKARGRGKRRLSGRLWRDGGDDAPG